MYMKNIDINIFNSWAKNHIVDKNKIDDDDFIFMKNDYKFK